MAKVIVGALVGMGPNSTAPFYDLVMNYARKLYGAKNDLDFPEMVMISLPTPFIPGKELDHERMISTLTDAIVRLNSLEVNYIVIPCNLVHCYYEMMQKVSNAPILNIVTITVETLSKLPLTKKSIALIATDSVADAGLYQKEILTKGFEVFHTRELQNKVNNLLIELKANQPADKINADWQDIINYLKINNCMASLIACTDISPCIKFDTSNLLFVDSIDALAKATIEQYIRLKRLSLR